MRVVLYTHDMEPITVFDLPEHSRIHLEKYRFARFAIPLQANAFFSDEIFPVAESMKLLEVTITAEWFVRYGKRHMFLFTSDEETALMMKSAFLPGQTHTVNDLQRSAFARGFICAINGIGR